MQKIKLYEHVNPGEQVWNGYPDGYCTAPQEDGLYTLYELADESNTHSGWEWVKE